MGKLGCCCHPDSKFQGALPSKSRTPRCSERVPVLSRRGEDSQAHGPSGWQAGWQMRGGCRGVWIPGSAQRLRDSCGVPVDRCASQGASVLKKDDLRKEGVEVAELGACPSSSSPEVL